MPNLGQNELEERILRVAEAALARQYYVGALDVLCGLGLLRPAAVDGWRKGRIEFLDQAMRFNPRRVQMLLAVFHRWAHAQGLKTCEIAAVRRTRTGTIGLRFSHGGDTAVETGFRTYYFSASLPEHRQLELQQKLGRAPLPFVFRILHDTRCSECGADVAQAELLAMEADQPLCLQCAYLEELDFVSASDSGLLQLAAEWSERSAVVVRFHRCHRRYERQGLLVNRAALEKAERECLADADERSAARVRETVYRHEQCRELALRLLERINQLFPGAPSWELARVAEFVAVREHGRVGRSEAVRNLEGRALSASIVAAIRRYCTDYDKLLVGGMDRTTARRCVGERVEELLAAWRR